MEQNQQSTSSNGSGVPPPPEPLMYKNHLITYTQRSAIPLPVYETVNLGYRCTVHVNGVAYTTADTFRNPKDAEQEASKLALESIAKKIKEESIAIINKDPVSCKSILNEYAVKLNLPIPMYTTTQLELLPIFNSSLEFNGKSYTGPAARSKKDAERLAARMAIHSIIGASGSGTSLPEIIISKSRLSNASRMLEESQTIQDSHAAMVATPGCNCGGSTRKRKQILNPSSQTFNEGVTSTPPPSECKKPREENSCEMSAGPIGNVQHLLDQPVSISEHCRAVSDPSRAAEESQTIQDTKMVTVTSPGSNSGGSRMKGKEILNSSFSQTPVEVVTATPTPSNGIGNTTSLLDQPVDGCLDRKDTLSYKSILNEYAVKMNHPVLAYTTTQADPHSFFVSSLVFNGKTYAGPAARNKKDAERLAARTVIHSITGTSDPGTCLSEIMKFKSRLSNAPRKDVGATPSPSHEIKKPKEEPLFETNAGPIGNVAPLLDQPVGGC
ncbi:hypothetical protein C5167_012265 [Papaver somniferum]|uniref:DRBM domain-containing protein n=1 Tax=Papaver somniferum TaxID=3469 RepID=A0A4Y7J065_PAPSO|nr:uncharacterized protein LOC113355452 [Papaver somniferum]XP_026454097.1 uncharacterized protein LOC113355452 [Papaver somniferum]RZC53412.1 hypothetical protein C5167_012265 [Papaver somniferum]